MSTSSPKTVWDGYNIPQTKLGPKPNPDAREQNGQAAAERALARVTSGGNQIKMTGTPKQVSDYVHRKR